MPSLPLGAFGVTPELGVDDVVGVSGVGKSVVVEGTSVRYGWLELPVTVAEGADAVLLSTTADAVPLVIAKRTAGIAVL